MRRFKNIAWIYLLDVLICIISVLGLYQQYYKASNQQLVAMVSAPGADIDRVLIVDGKTVSSAEQLEFVLDTYEIGSAVKIQNPVLDGEQEPSSQIFVLESRYSVVYFIVTIFVSLVFVVLALIVLQRKFGERSAHIFHHLCMMIALLLCTNPGSIHALPEALSKLLLGLFFISYCLVPVLLCHFTFVFPKDKSDYIHSYTKVAYAVSIVIGTLLGMQAMIHIDSPGGSFTTFDVLFALCRSIFIAYVILGIARLVRSFRQSENSEERRKVQWVLMGYSVSVSSFAILWLLPQLVLHRSIMAEEWNTLLIVIAPVTFAIAIVRYRALDIDVLVNRGTVYLLVVALVLGIYAVLMTLAVSVVGQSLTTLYYIIPVIILVNVLLFVPARGLIQGFVDRTFFRVQYHYRNTQKVLLDRVSHCLTEQQLSDCVVSELNVLFHPERLVFAVREHDDKLLVRGSIGFESESITDVELYDPKLFVSTYTLLGDDESPSGYLCCGMKKSGQKYIDEDVDLLVTLCAQCGSMLQRFRLQKELLEEHIETERLAELNELKSYFVSGVTHDLKTPLTSIRMFAEMLHSHVSSDKAQSYLTIIEGESDRLTRLVNNVLDYAKMEHGMKEYHRSETDVHDTIDSVLDLMQYQIQMGGFELSRELNAQQTVLHVDADAFVDVLINLITNSLKYSSENKAITLLTESDENNVRISVIDKSVGIAEDELENIFEPFVRLKNSGTARTGGVGLGLALVKHFVDAHGGKIEIQSKVNAGTKVTIVLPL